MKTSESYFEYLKNNPPKLTLKGWWWKKYFSHFKRQQEIMQELSDYRWINYLVYKISPVQKYLLMDSKIKNTDEKY